MNRPSLRTDRLLLRRWQASDIEPFAAMCGDPQVMRFIGAGETRSREQAALSIESFEREWEHEGFGLFALELLEDGSFIGFTGLSRPNFLPEVMPGVEIGWRLAREHWGRGHATEAARAALGFGLETLGLPAIICIFQTGNEASRRIAKKLGLEFERRTIDPSCNREIEVFTTTA